MIDNGAQSEADDASFSGPLVGMRVVEFESIGPGPFAAMMLADMGADVVRVERPGTVEPDRTFTGRGRRSVVLDLKTEGGRQDALELMAHADVVIEGLRPGVMERLGLGPNIAIERNPSLVYGRMTGWGQDGPLAHSAGHDINFIAITGALASMRRGGEKPAIPLNMIGDLGGGAMLLVAGILAAFTEARNSGKGQVVDAAISDGVNLFTGVFHALRQEGRWDGVPGENILDGGAHFYNTYECADGRYIAVGPVEPQFYAMLCERLGINDEAFKAQYDRSLWPGLSARLAQVFRTKTRDEWCVVFEGSDACFAPVFDLSEAPHHPHNKARNSFVEVDGAFQPVPAPRFSRTPSKMRSAAKTYKKVSDILSVWRK